MHHHTLDHDSLTELAEAVLTMPDSFASWDDNVCTSHGLMFGTHRDSGVLERSNWEVVKGDLTERFPEDVYEFHASHWAVGWVDQLAVRVYRYPSPVHRVFTDAFLAAAEWKASLDDYPVADEMHYSELEMDDALETLTQCYGVPGDRSVDVWRYLFDAYSYSSAEEYNDDAVADAIAYLHLDCQRCGDHRAVMLQTQELQYGTIKQAVCIACVIAFPDLPHERVEV